jgi:hypothetical protein
MNSSVVTAAGTAEIRAGEIVATQRVMKGFGDPIRFGTAHRRGDRREAMSLSRDHRLERGVDRAVVAEPLNRVRCARRVEAMADSSAGECANIVAVQFLRRRDPGEALAIATVEREGGLHDLAVPARDLDRVARPPLVRDGPRDVAAMGTRRSVFRRPRGSVQCSIAITRRMRFRL